MNVKPMATYAADEDMTATALLAIAMDLYGTECFEWLPSTLIGELEQDLRVDLPQVNVNRLNAAIALLTTDSFYRDPLAFMHTCRMLWGDQGYPSADDQTPPDPVATAWGVFEASMLDPDHAQKYTEDVKTTVGMILQQNGIQKPPKTLHDVTIMPSYGDIEPAGELGSDPTIVQMMFTRTARDTAELDETVAKRFDELVEQLHYLPLNTRDKESWNAIIQKIGKVKKDSQRPAMA